MTTTPQKRALKRYRDGLGERGLARFEVLGLGADRELIRGLAKRLAGNDAESVRIRDAVRTTLAGGEAEQGGILQALRRSPLVGAALEVKRSRTSGRKVEL